MCSALTLVTVTSFYITVAGGERRKEREVWRREKEREEVGRWRWRGKRRRGKKRIRIRGRQSREDNAL